MLRFRGYVYMCVTRAGRWRRSTPYGHCRLQRHSQAERARARFRATEITM